VKHALPAFTPSAYRSRGYWRGVLNEVIASEQRLASARLSEWDARRMIRWLANPRAEASQVAWDWVVSRDAYWFMQQPDLFSGGRTRKVLFDRLEREDDDHHADITDGDADGAHQAGSSEPHTRWRGLGAGDAVDRDWLSGGGWSVRHIATTGTPVGRPSRGATDTDVIAMRVEELRDGFELGAMKAALKRGNLTPTERAARDELAAIVAQIALGPKAVNRRALAGFLECSESTISALVKRGKTLGPHKPVRVVPSGHGSHRCFKFERCGRNDAIARRSHGFPLSSYDVRDPHRTIYLCESCYVGKSNGIIIKGEGSNFPPSPSSDFGSSHLSSAFSSREATGSFQSFALQGAESSEKEE
jgi:hypothetical protein